MASSARARHLIERLALQPHPEGGFYVEVHRSAVRVQPGDGRSTRAALTSIYFLLADHGASRWHRVASDEVWLHLEGAPLTLYLLDEATHVLRSVRLGALSTVGDVLPQVVVPAGVWQATQLDGDGHALLACVVAPGFVFDDFAMVAPDSALAGWLRRSHPVLARLL